MLKSSSILLVFLVPVSLIVLTRIFPSKFHPVSGETVISEAEARRMEAEERRAERAEARRERRAARRAMENEQRSLEESERWFAGNGGRSGFGDDGEQSGFEGNPAPGMMPLPMPPMLPDVAYGRMRGGRGFGGGEGFDGFGYGPDAGFDKYGANGFGNDYGNGFGRF